LTNTVHKSVVNPVVWHYVLFTDGSGSPSATTLTLTIS